MNIEFKYHSKYPETILVRKVTGKISAEDVLVSLKKMKNLLEEKPSVRCVLNDLLDCELDMNMETFMPVLIYVKNQDWLKNIKMAVVTKNPKTIVFPILAEKKESRIKAFSSYEAAENWLLK